MQVQKFAWTRVNGVLIETFRFEDENDHDYEILILSFFAYSQNIDTLEFFIVLFSPEKLAMLSFLKEVKTSLDRKMRKLLTLDKLYPHYDTLTKTRSRMTTATTFSRQNDAASRASTTYY